MAIRGDYVKLQGASDRARLPRRLLAAVCCGGGLAFGAALLLCGIRPSGLPSVRVSDLISWPSARHGSLKSDTALEKPVRFASRTLRGQGTLGSTYRVSAPSGITQASGNEEYAVSYDEAAAVPLARRRDALLAPFIATGGAAVASIIFGADAKADVASDINNAAADVAREVARQQFRPDMSLDEATTDLLYARAVLLQIQDAATKVQAGEDAKQFSTSLRAWGKLLAKVGAATPIVVRSIYGGAALGGYDYGGEEQAVPDKGNMATNDIFQSVGQVLRLSGGAVQDRALKNPSLAKEAVSSIEKVLDQLPAGYVDSLKAKANTAK